MLPRLTLPRLVLLAGLALPSTVLAGGFETGDNGTRALGRAGAYAASAAEPSAIYYNPAALTRIDGSAITLNLHLVDENTRFERAPYIYDEAGGFQDPEREIRFDPVEQQTAIFPAPMLFAASNFGLEHWAFGLGVYGPPAFGASSYPEMTRRPADSTNEDVCGVYAPCNDRRSTDLDESVVTRDGGQSYMITDQNILLVYPSLSVARAFERADLSIGLTLQLAALFVDYGVAVDGEGSQAPEYNFQSRESDDFYTPTQLDVKGLTVTGILGALWEPSDRFAMGASFRPRFNVVAKGTIDIEFPPGLSGAGLSLSEDTAELRLTMPDVLRFGLVYTHRNAADKAIFDLEANFVWENWSVLENYRVDVPGQVQDTAGTLQDRNIPTLYLGRNYNDAFSFRLGSDISALLDEEGNGPVFRLGASYETPSSPEAWTNLDFTPFARVGGTAGFSWQHRGLSIDIAYAYYWSPDRVVDNGKYEILTPLWVCEDPANSGYPAEDCADPSLDPGHAVNNGRYETWSQIFSVGGTYAW